MEKRGKLKSQDIIIQSSCFDLQFRRDIRYERPNSPTYYRWKIQFIVTTSKEHTNALSKIKKIIGCGKIHAINNQARFSVQKIDDINKFVVPFFNKNQLHDKKKRDFALWQRAVSIIHRNKGKSMATWGKNDLLNLLAIHKSTLKYKNNPRQPKWMGNAKLMAQKS